MTKSAKVVIAGPREEGTICRHCQKEIRSGDQTAICSECGGIHHEACWTGSGGCGEYGCTAGSGSLNERTDGEFVQPILRVSNDELARTKPLATNVTIAPGWMPAPSRSMRLAGPRRWSRLAIASLVCAIVGIPLFGIVTGLIAVVLGCIALVGHSRQWKGAALAVTGIVLGIVDVAGWTIGLYVIHDVAGIYTNAADNFELDHKALQELPAAISRAMKSNVLIQTSTSLAMLSNPGIGSGVIVRIEGKTAWIVTNRHVVDDNFTGEGGDASRNPSKGTVLMVKAVGQPIVAAQRAWVAPHGIDLALITMPITSSDAAVATWDAEAVLTVGSEVFAIGNPHGLGWTYTPGGISQMRLQKKGPLEIRVVQTSAAINPGNSGGGLYGRDGRLIGINTWTNDKRFSEGLSFSIAFHTLLPLLPKEFRLPDHQLETDIP